VEIFSLGVVLFKMIFKQFPFTTESIHVEGRDPNFVQKFINSDKNVNKVKPSDTLVDLLQKMLSYNQRDRCNLDQIFQSNWFQ